MESQETMHGLRARLAELEERIAKLNDESRRENEYSLRESQLIAGLGSYLLNIAADTWSSSDVLDEVLGIDASYPHDIAGWAALVHPDDRPMMVDYLRNEVLAEGRPFTKEYRIIRPSDQSIRWVHGLGKLEFDSENRPVKMRGTIQDITERKRMDEVQVFLARTSSWNVNEPFFKTLSRYLASSLKMEYVFIDKLNEDGLTATTLAVWIDVQHGENLTYALEGTPCGDLVGKAVRCFPSGVQDLFPSHQLLKDLNAECYIGVTLFSHTGKPIGLIGALGRKPLAQRSEAESILRLVAMRAEGELERMDAEQTLRSSQRMIEGIINTIPVRVFWKDKNLVYLGCNTAFARDAGCSKPEDIIGKNDFELGWSDQAEIYRAADRKVIESGVPILEIEEPQTTPDGSPIILLTSKTPLLDSEGNVSGVLGTYTDITARKREEESLSRLATAVEQTGETIVITDTGGRILYANPAFEKSTGYTSAEAIGQNPRILKSERQDPAFYRELWQTLERGEVWTGHFFNQRKDGSVYEEDATISPVRDHKGTVINYVAVKRDVTREVQLQAQLRQSQKMEAFGQLAGGVAHDFNNILGAMMLQAEVTAMADGVTEEIRNGLQQIRTDAARAANLTRQLLLFSHKQVLQSRELDLNESVANLTKMLQRIIGEDVRLQVALHPRPLATRADPGMIDQMMMNLVINSRDAIRSGGRILVRTAAATLTPDEARSIQDAAPGSYVTLSVTDDGSGIPPEIMARIFEPFFTTKGPGKGSGLGLATVFGIVKQHGGFMQVESGIGSGSTFKVFLPAIEVAASPPPAEENPAPRGGTETILVVEDEAQLRKLTVTVLEMHGYRVLEAAHGVQALDVWDHHDGPIHMLLTDMVMPEGISGKELAKRLIERNPQLRVIFTSGYNSEISGRELTLEAGQDFIQKPASPLKLLAAVRQCLDVC